MQENHGLALARVGVGDGKVEVAQAIELDARLVLAEGLVVDRDIPFRLEWP